MDAVSIVDGFRRALQDIVAPELRTLTARVDANTESIRLLREDFRDLAASIDRRFDRVEACLNDHDDVQTLKAQMARLLERDSNPLPSS